MTTRQDDANVTLSAEALESELKNVLSRVRSGSGAAGPIDPKLLPAIRAGAAVVGALLNDGQLELANSVLSPIAEEVNRIITRGY